MELAPLQILMLFVASLQSPGLRLLAEKPAGISFGLFLRHFSALWLHDKLKTHVSKPQPEGQVLPLLFTQHHDVGGGGGGLQARKINPSWVSLGLKVSKMLSKTPISGCAGWHCCRAGCRRAELPAEAAKRRPAPTFCPGCWQSRWTSISLRKAGPQQPF